MSMFLLAIETALVAVLFVGLVLALLGRTRRRWLYLALGLPLVLFQSVVLSSVSWTSYMLTFERQAKAYFPEVLLLTVVVVVGGWWLLISGARKRDGKLRAATWPWAWLLIAWLLASTFQLLTVYAVDSRVQARAAVERQTAAAHFADLIGPTPSEADNAWPVYEEAFAKMSDVFAEVRDELEDKRNKELVEGAKEAEKIVANAATQPADVLEAMVGQLQPSGPTSAADLLDKQYIGKPELADLLKRLEPALVLVRTAAQRPANRGAQKSGLPTVFDTLGRDQYRQMRMAAVALQIHAIEAARQGKFDAAMDDVRTLHRMADHVDQSLPALISGLIRIGIHACAYDALVEALPYAKDALKLPEGVPADERPFRAAMDRDVRGEEELMVGTMLGFGDGTLDMAGEAGLPQRAAPAYRLLWLESDIPAIRALMADVRDQQAGRPPNRALYGRGGVPKGSMFVSILMPSVSRAFHVSEKLEATAHQARIAVALTEYRLAHGAYPAKLDELVPRWLAEIPADPADNKPMKYRLDGKDALIYSIGENLKDDGGDIDAPRATQGDVGLRLKAGVLHNLTK